MALPPSNRWRHLNNRPTVRTQIIRSSIMALSINSRCMASPNQNWINSPHKPPESTNLNTNCTQISSKLLRSTVKNWQGWTKRHTTSKTQRGPPSNRGFRNKSHPSRYPLTSRVKTTGPKTNIFTHFRIPPWNLSTPQPLNTTWPSPRYRTLHNQVAPPHLLSSACLHFKTSACSTTLSRLLRQTKICTKFPKNIRASPITRFLSKLSKLSSTPLWPTITSWMKNKYFMTPPKIIIIARSCSPNSSSTRFRRSQASPLQTQPSSTKWTTKSSMTIRIPKSYQILACTCKTWSSIVQNKCIISSHLSSNLWISPPISRCHNISLYSKWAATRPNSRRCSQCHRSLPKMRPQNPKLWTQPTMKT
jgi:hypothetical protein